MLAGNTFGRRAGKGKLDSPAESRAMMTALERSQAVIQFNLDGTIITANENFLQTMGYSLAEIQGQHHRMFVEPGYETSAEYESFWQSLRSGAFQSARYKRVAKGGREIWLQASYNPIVGADGKPVKIVKFATDITEETLRNADQAGQVSAISKSQAVIEFELDGTIITANENFLNAMGYALREVQGQHHRIFVDPKDAAKPEYQAFWDRLRRGEYQAAEYRRLGKGGKEVWIQASYNPILDPNGKVFKIVKFATDITAQVRARQEAERVGQAVDQNLEKILGSVGSANSQSAAATSASGQTLETVQAVASSTEELEASSREISQSMTLSKTEVDRAMQEAAGADESTQKLTAAAESMNSIVEIIQDIAAQINLLALNATIEAARVGDAGKGFAVVASEVKILANQVAKATEQISSEIAGMQTVSSDVVARLGTIKQAVEGVESSVTGVAGAVEEQSATTREIASNMQQAAWAVQEVNTKLETISQAVHDADGLAKEGIEMYRELRSQDAMTG